MKYKFALRIATTMLFGSSTSLSAWCSEADVHSLPVDPTYRQSIVPAGFSTWLAQNQTTPALKGGVRKVELSLEKLRDVGLDLKQILSASRHLYDEVTIAPVDIQTEPEVVGMGTVIYIPIGTRAAGPPAPARKERVDRAMGILKPIITAMKQNADDFMEGTVQLDISPAVNEKLNPEFKNWLACVNDISGQLTKLESLTQGPPYDQPSIAAIAQDIQNNANRMDKTRRAIYKVIAKEGKRQKEMRS